MSIKSSNKHVVEFDKQAALAATGSDKPYLAMIVAAGYAAIDGAIGAGDRDAFVARLEKARPSATHKTLLDQKKSQIWSCVKIAFEYEHCAKAIFDTIAKVAPTPTGLYDIACSIRGKAMFNSDAGCKKKAINLPAVSAVAPSQKAMEDSIKAANAYRNDLSGASPRPLESVLESQEKMLIAFRDGKRNRKTGKVDKDSNGNAVTHPKITDAALGDIIAKLAAYRTALTANGKVVRLPTRKAKAA